MRIRFAARLTCVALEKRAQRTGKTAYARFSSRVLYPRDISTSRHATWREMRIKYIPTPRTFSALYHCRSSGPGVETPGFIPLRLCRRSCIKSMQFSGHRKIRFETSYSLTQRRTGDESSLPA